MHKQWISARVVVLPNCRFGVLSVLPHSTLSCCDCACAAGLCRALLRLRRLLALRLGGCGSLTVVAGLRRGGKRLRRAGFACVRGLGGPRCARRQCRAQGAAVAPQIVSLSSILSSKARPPSLSPSRYGSVSL
ncbi:unnamed protein product [Boreogadus saida]